MISLLHGRGGWGRKGRERERERYRWKSVVKENNTVIINIVPSVRRLVRRSLRNVQGGYIKYCKSDDSFVITLAVTRSFSVWRHRVPSSVSFLSLIFLAPVKSRLHTHVYTHIHTHRIVSPIVSAISTICWCMSYTVRLDVGVYFSPLSFFLSFSFSN